MSAQFTPGPWLAAAKPSSVAGWPIVATPTGRMIASVNYVQTSAIDPKVAGDDAFNREAEANAHLIAAAPDLYEALAKIGCWVEHVERTPITAAHNIADAFRLYGAPALASARGEPQ